MRPLFFVCVLALLSACNPEGPDLFIPLTEEQRFLLPASYRDGDTVSFLYTDSLGSDTQHFIVSTKNYVYTAALIPEYSNTYECEVLDKELSPLDSGRKLNVAIGCLGYDDPYGQYQHFYVFYGEHRYETLIVHLRDTPDTMEYKLNHAVSENLLPVHYANLSYSNHFGIYRLEDLQNGYKLELLP